MSSRSETALTDGKYVPASLKWMFIVAGVLIAIGAINVYSATYYMNIKLGASPYAYLKNHLIYLAMGAVAAWTAAHTPKSWIRKWRMIWAGAVVAMLFVVMVAGVNVNGATRWLGIGGFTLQPSEFAKVAGVLWASYYLAKHVAAGEEITLLKRFVRPFAAVLFGLNRRKKANTFQSMLEYFMPLYLPLLMAGFVIKQPDMGTAGMILIFPVLLYVIAGLPKIEMFLGAGLTAFAFAALVAIEPYRMKRVEVFADPFRYAQGDGYQVVQSIIAVGSGGFWGQSLGEGMAKFLYLPEQYTDFAFAVFSQEFGFIGSVFVLLLYVAFLIFGFITARELKEIYAALVVYGLTMLISLQGILNIAMVIGFFPVTGVPLPFISYGGSSLITNLIALGLIWGTAVQSLTQTDLEERRRRINAMEGRGYY